MAEEYINTKYARFPEVEKDDTEVKTDDDTVIKVYNRRWYILMLFSLVAWTQALLWNTWGPVSDSALQVFHWNNGVIANMANIGNIAFMITVFLGIYILETTGLRIATLASAGLMVIGTGIRCFSAHPTVLLWTSYVCAALCGIAGSVPFAGPAAFSIRWFPPNQRATATAIVSLFNYMGVALSFVIGPAFVHYIPLPKNNHTNITTWPDSATPDITSKANQSTTLTLQETTTATSNETAEILVKQQDEMMLLMYVECGWTVLLLLLVVIYFPSRPPLPPSAAASIPRISFKTGLTRVVRSPAMWLITLAYSLPTGPFNVWFPVLNVILKPLNVSQYHSAYMGFYATLAGAVSGLVVARFADIFSKHMKGFLLLFYVLAVAALSWAVLLCLRFITFSLGQLYAASIIAGLFVNGAIPLFYELSSEVCFPISEGLVGGFMTGVQNVIGSTFLVLVDFPSLGTDWIMWSLPSTVAAGIPLLLLLKENYARLDIDIQDADHRKEIQS